MNICQIKNTKKITPYQIGSLIKSFFKDKYNFHVHFNLENESKKSTEISLFFKDVKVLIWTKNSKIEMPDSAMTSFMTSDNFDSPYMKITKIQHPTLDVGISFYFIFDLIQSLLSKEMNTYVDSESIGKIYPESSISCPIHFKTISEWLPIFLKESPMPQNEDLAKYLKDESLYFPEFY